MEKDGAYKMDTQNKKCSCASAKKSGRKKNNAELIKKTLGQQVTKEDEIKGIPVIINRFALPSEYIPDAI